MKLIRQEAAGDLERQTCVLHGAQIRTSYRSSDGHPFDYIVLFTSAGTFTSAAKTFDPDKFEIGDEVEIMYKPKNGYRNVKFIRNMKEKQNDETHME